MITLSGKSVFGGIAIGKIAFYKRNEIQIKRSRVEDTEQEVKRFEAAKEKAVSQLQELHDKALDDVGETNAMIFEIHQMMLEDLDYVESIVNIITSQEVNAEYAVATTADNFAAMFAAMDDAYMQGRAADVKDVSERLIQVLSDQNSASMEMNEPVIIAADDLVSLGTRSSAAMITGSLQQMILSQARQYSWIKKKFFLLLQCTVLQIHIPRFWQER